MTPILPAALLAALALAACKTETGGGAVPPPRKAARRWSTGPMICRPRPAGIRPRRRG